MKLKSQLLLIAVAGLSVLMNCSSSTPQRYSDEIFTDADYPADFEGGPNNPIEVTYGQNFSDSAMLWDDDASNDGNQTEDLKMDIYLPPPSDTVTHRPVMVFVHGGGFIQGDKAAGPMLEFAQSFAKRGWVAISANYRLFPLAKEAEKQEFILEQESYDIKAAIRWIKKHENMYSADSERVGVGGSSAGAFVSIQAAYNNTPADNPTEQGEGDSNNLFTTDGIHSNVLGVMNLWGAGTTDIADLVDPNDPPVVVVHCNQDPVVFAAQVMSFVDVIKADGIPFSSDDNLIPGASHGIDAELALPVTAPFLAKYVAGADVGSIPTLRSTGVSTCPSSSNPDQ